MLKGKNKIEQMVVVLLGVRVGCMKGSGVPVLEDLSAFPQGEDPGLFEACG